MIPPIRIARLWGLLVLCLLGALSALCQPGPEELSFEKLDSNGVPDGWQVYGFEAKDGKWGEVRQEGCRTSGKCVYVRSHMDRSLPIAEFAGRAVRVTGWVKSVRLEAYRRPSIDVLAGGRKGRRRAVEQRLETNDGWQRVESILFVDPEDQFADIDLNGTGLFQKLTFEALTNKNGAPPEKVRELYRSLDGWISEGHYDRISSFLFKDPVSDRKPFATRIGLKSLSTGNVTLASRTQIVSAFAARDDLIRIHARCELQRASPERTYRYLLDYNDIWIRTANGWKLIDDPPASVEDEDLANPARSGGERKAEQSRLCGLKPSPSLAPDLTLAPSDYEESVRPWGQLKALMLFVEFPTTKHDEKSEPASKLYVRLVPQSVRAIALLSHGRATLKVDTDFQWHQMAARERDYEKYGTLTSALRWDALLAAKKDGADVSNYDLYYIVTPTRAWLRTGALRGRKVFPADQPGRHIQAAHITATEDRGLTIFHETAHLFGLPDLYIHDDPKLGELKDWDAMGDLDYPLLTAWNRAKLGWISDEQLQCVANDARTVTLTPAAVPEGVKAVALRVSESRAYVVELRELVGVDVNIREEAVLVYTVDASIVTGREPMRIAAKLRRTDEKQVFENKEVKVELLEAALGAYTVRVSAKK